MSERAKIQRPKYCTVISQLMDEHEHETQEGLAAALGVTRNKVENWLNYRSKLDIINLIKIAEHYGESVDYIVGASTARKKNATIAEVEAATGLTADAINSLSRFREWIGYRGALTVELSDMLTNDKFVELCDRLNNISTEACVLKEILTALDMISDGADTSNEAVRDWCMLFFMDVPDDKSLKDDMLRLFSQEYINLKYELYELTACWSEFVESFEPTRELIARGKKYDQPITRISKEV